MNHTDIPCRVSIEERAHDRGEQKYSAADLKEARTEIVDAIMESRKGWRGKRLFVVLQEYLNTEAPVFDARLHEIAKHLQHMMFGNPYDRPAPHADLLILGRADAETFFRGMVEDYIEEEWVDERAAEIAAEKLEDA